MMIIGNENLKDLFPNFEEDVKENGIDLRIGKVEHTTNRNNKLIGCVDGEKRLASSGDSFVDLTQMETVDLLNKLSDENTKLHKKVDEQQSTISQLKEENKELKHWKKRIIGYLTDWFQKTEYLSVLYKINEIRVEIGLDIDE